GNPVANFDLACRLVATNNGVANAVGGGTIYVAGTGLHSLRSYSNYSFGADMYGGSGQWWLEITPMDGLNREDVWLATDSTFDGNWVLFGGAGATGTNRLKFSNLSIDTTWGVTAGAGTNIKHEHWMEHCIFAPYELTGAAANGSGMPIKAYEGRGAPSSFGNGSNNGYRYATSCTSYNHIFPLVGTFVRGWRCDRSAGPVIQINEHNAYHKNIVMDGLFGNDGVSGYFPAFTDTFSLESLGGSIYQLQSGPSYAGLDIAADVGYWMSGMTEVGIQFSGVDISTGYVVGYGYSGSSKPYLLLSGTMVAQGYSTSQLALKTSVGYYWEEAVHSDIVQFNGSNTRNTILSDIAVSRGYQTQGIYDGVHSLSGVAMVNIYDGFVNPSYGLQTRSYFVGTPSTPITLTHILMRNCTLEVLQVDATYATYSGCEYIDNCFSGFSAIYGTTATFASLVDLNYNHFRDVTAAQGTNFTSGDTYFIDPDPAETPDASVSPSSNAYGTASTLLWDKPSQWNTTSSKGVLDNVAGADWSYSFSNVSVTKGPLSTESSLVPPTPSLTKSVSKLENTSALRPARFKISKSPDPITSNNATVGPDKSLRLDAGPIGSESRIPVGYTTDVVGGYRATTLVSPSSLISPSVSYSFEKTLLPTTYLGIETPSLYAQEVVRTATSTIYLGVENSAVIFGISTARTAQSIVLGIEAPPIASVSTEIVSPDQPSLDPNLIPTFEVGTPGSNPVLSARNNIKDHDILPVLSQLNLKDGDVSKIQATNKQVWTQQIVRNISSPLVAKAVIGVYCANYQKFATPNTQSIFLNKRRRF
ncbi:MAG: hypothetical protein KDH96_08245, partial [Candidatus Riesia sp.]|nr:hypothetical protein [Candidatus Riesia sp.]